jgi:hypothetical protein
MIPKHIIKDVVNRPKGIVYNNFDNHNYYSTYSFRWNLYLIFSDIQTFIKRKMP